jgi:hypothetical protein
VFPFLVIGGGLMWPLQIPFLDALFSAHLCSKPLVFFPQSHTVAVRVSFFKEEREVLG